MTERLVTRNCKCREKTGSEGVKDWREKFKMAASGDELEEEDYEALAYQQV